MDDVSRERAGPEGAGSAPLLLSGGGEMGALIRAMDWSRTPIGPVETWSQSLRMMVSFLLANRFPLLLWWGPQFVQIYNDAYRPIPGAKHPQSMGQPASECWSEIWHIIGPLIETPFNGGPATWMEDIPLEINRYGFVEETHFTIAYSPVPDETAPHGIGGVLATVHEITEKVVAERRVVILRDLGTRTAEGRTAEEACTIAAATLANHAKDVPFALLYLIDPDGKAAHLAGAAGVEPGAPAAPASIRLDPVSAAPWPLLDAVEREGMVVVEDVAARFARVPVGPWSEPPRTAVVVPVRSNKAHQLAGLLVVGVSPRLRFDELYRSFLELVAAQIATSIANARAYEEERKRAEALAEIDRAKTTFFSNVSHEFRTPLTLMLGPLEEALAAPAESLPKRREGLALVHRNGLRLLRLVNTLLDFSRIEAGRVQASYEPVDLAGFTAELASVFRAATEKAGLFLTVDCPRLPELAWIDRDMWEKIVLNLLSNAFKFTFEGGIAVRLRHEGGSAVLAVGDTGTGIPEHELPRLFDRFHRVEGARGRTHEGTGIGLALVQELVKLHDGAVRVESTLGKGSTFTVTIPLGKAHLPADRLNAERTLVSTALGAQPYLEEALRWLPGATSGVSADELERELLSEQPAVANESERATILLADDNADMRYYLRRLLAPYYEVRMAADGAAALASLRARRPDLLLSDVMMPGLDGFALVRKIRADPALADLPIVLLSARAGEEASIEGLEAGADDYLVKPFSARELLARVRANLEMARVRRQYEDRLAADLAAMTRLHAIGNRCVRGEYPLLECLQDILDAAIDITAAAKGNIQLLDSGSGMLEIAVQRGFEEPFLTFFAKVSWGDSAACGAAMRTAERVIVEDVTESEIFQGQASRDVLLEAGVRAVQSTPLLSSNGKILGMISTHFTKPYRPDERELRLIDLLARQAAEYLERRRAEAELRESEERFRALAETVPSLIFVADTAGENTYVNAHFQSYTGLGADELLGSGWLSAVHPEDRAPAAAHWRESWETGSPYSVEYRFRDAAGRYRWHLVRANPVRDAQGRITQWIGSGLDVQELRESENRLRATIQAAPFPMMLHAEDGEVIELSRKWMELSGYSRGQLRTHFDWVRLAYPDAVDENIKRIADEFGQEGESVTGPLAIRSRDGTARLWDFYNARIGRLPDGRRVQICAANDVTDRRRAEEAVLKAQAQLLTIFENTPLGVYLVDGDFRIRAVNPVARPVFGDIPDLIGRDFAEVMHILWPASYADEVVARFRHTLETGESYAVPERVEQRLDRGVNEYYEWQIQRVPLPATRHGVVCYFRDISAEVFARREIEASAKRLHELNESLERKVEERSRALAAEMAERQKIEAALHQAQRLEAVGRLTGGVAHDFNNLLTVIIGQAEAITMAAEENQRITRMAAAALRAAERGAQLTNQLLSFAGRQQLRPVTLALDGLIRGVGDLVRRTIGETISVEISLDPKLWPAHLDSAQFESAVLNLAINARDAMPEGGRLIVAARNARIAGDEAKRLGLRPGDYVVVTVTDTGSGMPAEVQRRAFEPFFTTKDIGKGTGLGLSQVYGFVRQSGGTAAIESAPGEGTTVELYLPRASGTIVDKPSSARRRKPRSGDGRTVLVVEDQADVREIIETTLDDLGYRVLTAADGVMARRVLESNEAIDLLLTDVIMPNGVSGLDLARDARRLRQDLKIVIVSGYFRESQHRAAELPGVIFLEKPFLQTELADTIAAALGKKASSIEIG